MRLDDRAVAAGFRLLALGTVGSTNTEARRRAADGERGPLWITATAQTQGRGRMARSWVSPPGNLYASLLLPDPSSFDRAPELAFVAALAVRDAVIAAAPALAAKIALKWPNDVLIEARKFAGILIEGEGAADKTVIVIMGIGVNCASHPPAASFPATDLATEGVAVDVARLFECLSATMGERLTQWDRGQGFAQILTDWRTAAHGLGEQVTVRNGSGEKRGRFASLDTAGRLVLELADGGVEKIAAGDVFPLDARSGVPAG